MTTPAPPRPRPRHTAVLVDLGHRRPLVVTPLASALIAAALG